MTNKFDKAVAAYLSDAKYRGISKTTIDNYEKRIGYFREFLKDSEPSAEAVRAWRDALVESGKSSATVRQYLVELKAFFEFACDEELHDIPYYTKNPVSKKLFPRVGNEGKKPYDKILDNNDIKALWMNTKQKSKGRYWARNYAIITLLLDGKIRNAELLDIKLKDIDFEHKEITIPKGKGDKYRVVTLSDISLSAVKLYLKSGLRPAYCTEDDYLFGTTAAHAFGENQKHSDEKWHRGTSQWLSKLVENHVKTVTGKSGFRTHSMRHNGAVIDLNTGSSLERIQAELGHSSITTTEIYAGRLQPARHAREMDEVIAARDQWAAENLKMLARKNA